MSKRIVEVSEKLSHITSETSDYGNFSRKSGIPPAIKQWAGRKITEIFSTKINRCNLYLIAGIKRSLYIFRLFQSSLVRDMLIHEYFGVDLDLTWKVVKKDIYELKRIF